MFSNYAKANCPPDSVALPTLCKGDGSAPDSAASTAGPYWSLMFEISESQYKPVNMGMTTLGGTAGSW